MFVTTEVLLHTFVVTKDMFCCNKTFVATKMILVAAPANDSGMTL